MEFVLWFGGHRTRELTASPGPEAAQYLRFDVGKDIRMELAVIILNWNAAVDTIRCVQDVLAWRHLQPTIWVVDNGSADDSAETIARELPAVRVIPNAKNLGFGGGNNRGIAKALAVGNAPILLLNNDAFVSEEDILRLLQTLGSDKRIGLIGPLLFNADARDQLLAAGGKDPVHHHHSHVLRLTPGETVRMVDYVPGTVLLGRSELYRQIGFLDEDYFFTMEVADLCLRAKQHGYASAIDTRSRAFHALGRSSHLRETLHAYYVIRNRFLFIRKFYSRRRIPLFGAWALYSLLLVVKVRVGGRPAMARAVWLGLLDGIRGRFGGQNDRLLAARSKKTPEPGQ